MKFSRPAFYFHSLLFLFLALTPTEVQPLKLPAQTHCPLICRHPIFSVVASLRGGDLKIREDTDSGSGANQSETVESQQRHSRVDNHGLKKVIDHRTNM
jgi:hypothetical protein